MRLLDVVPQISIITEMLRKLFPTLMAFLVVYLFLLVAFAMPIFILISPVKTSNSSTSTEFPLYSHSQMDSLTNEVTDFFKLVTKVVYNRFWNLVQFNLDDSRVEVEGVCYNGDDNAENRPITSLENCNDYRHAEVNFFAIALYIIFIILTHIIWINSLIAV